MGKTIRPLVVSKQAKSRNVFTLNHATASNTDTPFTPYTHLLCLCTSNQFWAQRWAQSQRQWSCHFYPLPFYYIFIAKHPISILLFLRTRNRFKTQLQFSWSRWFHPLIPRLLHRRTVATPYPWLPGPPVLDACNHCHQ